MRHATADTSDDTPHIETDVTLHAIRSMLMETSDDPADGAAKRPVVREMVEADTPAGSAKDAPLTEGTPRRLDLDAVKSALRAYRPTTQHMAYAVFALVLVFRPHCVLVSVALVLLVTIGAFACFGADRVWGTVMDAFQRFALRRPAQAARFSAKMDTFALRWDALLDRFPESVVGGLYLPDFQALSTRDEAHAEAMNARLAQMRSEA